MHILLEAVFSLFGKKALGQVIGATVIGVMVVGWHFLRKGERPPVGEFSTWLICGAAAGFTAGLILVSSRVFFGALFGLLGLAIAIVPMSHGEGTPAALGEYAVKIGIGVGLMLFSMILVVSRLRKVAKDRICEQKKECRERGGEITSGSGIQK